jgi:hypothetical protein
MKIHSGAGTPYVAEVDSNLNLNVRARTVHEAADISEREGLSFEFTSGRFQTLATGTGEQAMFHLENTSTTHQLHILSIRTCNTEVVKWIMYKNDTGGTLISTATAGVATNQNFSSANVASANVYVAAAGDLTRSGGSWFSQWQNGIGHSSTPYEGALIMGTGNSLTLTATADVSASTIEACVRIHGVYVPKAS